MGPVSCRGVAARLRTTSHSRPPAPLHAKRGRPFHHSKRNVGGVRLRQGLLDKTNTASTVWAPTRPIARKPTRSFWGRTASSAASIAKSRRGGRGRDHTARQRAQHERGSSSSTASSPPEAPLGAKWPCGCARPPTSPAEIAAHALTTPQRPQVSPERALIESSSCIRTRAGQGCQ